MDLPWLKSKDPIFYYLNLDKAYFYLPNDNADPNIVMRILELNSTTPDILYVDSGADQEYIRYIDEHDNEYIYLVEPNEDQSSMEAIIEFIYVKASNTYLDILDWNIFDMKLKSATVVYLQ